MEKQKENNSARKSVMFIKPNLETDAVWDAIRTCPYTGMWSLASKLQKDGHDVRYLDEVVRNGGLSRQEMFTRKLNSDGTIVDTLLDLSYDDFLKHLGFLVEKNLVKENVEVGCSLTEKGRGIYLELRKSLPSIL